MNITSEYTAGTVAYKGFANKVAAITGNIVITDSPMFVRPIGKVVSCAASAKWYSAKLTIKGIVKTVMQLLVAVNVTESATSPRAL